jgi:hypothetical protein
MVVRSAEATDVVDDHVVGPDVDLTVAAGTAIQLRGDPADEPRLVALIGEADEGGALVRKALRVHSVRRGS